MALRPELDTIDAAKLAEIAEGVIDRYGVMDAPTVGNMREKLQRFMPAFSALQVAAAEREYSEEFMLGAMTMAIALHDYADTVALEGSLNPQQSTQFE